MFSTLRFFLFCVLLNSFVVVSASSSNMGGDSRTFIEQYIGPFQQFMSGLSEPGVQTSESNPQLQPNPYGTFVLNVNLGSDEAENKGILQDAYSRFCCVIDSSITCVGCLVCSTLFCATCGFFCCCCGRALPDR